jgi:mannosyltransferase OCH1-like enzyme
MKIAYIFFGQVKNFSAKQFNAMRDCVLSKIDQHDIDFYLSTSRQEYYFSERQSQSEGRCLIDCYSMHKYFDFNGIFYDELDKIDCSEIKELAAHLVDSFGGAWGENSLQSTINSLKQLYSLEYFYNQFIKCNFEYDAFVLSRSDLFHTHVLNTECFDLDCDIAVPYFDDYPQIDYGWFGGINDRFAVIKNNDALKTYCTRYSRLKNAPRFYHAEQYLFDCIKEDDLNYEKIHNFEFRLLRGNGKITDLIGIYPDDSMNNLKNISKSFFINLDRRQDRLAHIQDTLPFFAERFSAFDSQNLELSKDVLKLYPDSYHIRSKSEICCAMGHYKLWKALAEDSDSDNYLILEDDVVFKEGFVKFWNHAFANHMPDDFDLIYLGGCQPWNKRAYHKVLEKYNNYYYSIKRNDYFTNNDHFWQMNTQSYIISKKAAIKICDWIEDHGISNALDHFMINFFNENETLDQTKKIYHLNPLMSYQIHEENDNTEIDQNSDIRNDSNKFQKIELTKIIHQSWKTKDIPYEVYKKEWVESWTQLNPEWEYKLWTDEDNRNLIKDHYPQYLELYDSYERAIAKADIVRLFYLHKFGGLYVDLDFRCLKPIDSIIVPEHINLGEQKTKEYKTNSIANALMYSPPGQDFWLKCADELINHKFINGELNATEAATGPIFLYNCLEKFKPQNLTVHESDIFYPVSWEIDGSAISQSLEQKWLDYPEQSFPDSYAITYWSGGWRLNIKTKTLPKINFIWQTPGGHEECFERDWLMELFSGFDINHIDDGEFYILKDNSVIIYSDMMCDDLSIYHDSIVESESKKKERRRQYFEKFNDRKSFLVHLSDEHRHATIDHYKHFNHVFRQYYRADAENKNVTFIPLGYKRGFNS